MKLIFFDEAKHDPDFPHYYFGAVDLLPANRTS
jgi:hypothetical protein